MLYLCSVEGQNIRRVLRLFFLYTLTDGVKVLRCEDVKMFIDAT